MRLRKLNDDELLRFGRAAAGMCSPEAKFGHAPRQVFVEQLREARADRRRRYAGLANRTCRLRNVPDDMTVLVEKDN